MTERADLSTDWSESPRLIEVAAPSTAITIQDLLDTCRSNTLQPGEGGDGLNNMDDDPIIDAAGKEDLGGGVLVGLSATLQNAQLLFETRVTPVSTGSVSTANAAGTNLIDATATFITDGVERGAAVINFTDESITEVLEVLSETELRTRVLRSGTDNDYDLSDAYKVWNIIQCDVEGGNLVSIDDVEAPISSIFPTAFTQIVRTSSSSATLQEQADIQFASFNGGVWVDPTGSNTGTVFPTGTERQPVNNFTDALAIAAERGFLTIYILGDATLDGGADYTNFKIIGQGQNLSTFTLDPTGIFVNSSFFNATITGTLDGDSQLENCIISTLTFVSGVIEDCILDAGTITLGGSETAHFINCASGVPGASTPIIDMGGSGQDLALRNYNGGIEIRNKTGIDSVSMDLNSGHVILDSTVTTGPVIARGVGKMTDNSTAGTGVTNELLEASNLKELWTLLGLDPNDIPTITPSGITTSLGSFTITFTGDGVTSTTMTRT